MKIAPEIESGLCDNCANHSSCTFRSGQIIECEEHILLAEIKQGRTGIFRTKPQTASTAYDGICSTCTLAPECRWIQEGTIRFQCEHYQ